MNTPAEEWERCLRLACAIVCGYDEGDKSLEFLRKGFSPEPGDLVLAIEAALRDRDRSIAMDDADVILSRIELLRAGNYGALSEAEVNAQLNVCELLYSRIHPHGSVQ